MGFESFGSFEQHGQKTELAAYAERAFVILAQASKADKLLFAKLVHVANVSIGRDLVREDENE